MKRMLTTIALAFAAPVIAQTPASEAVAVKLRDAALKANIAYDLVSELTTRFGPRPAGSSSERAAARWTAERLRKLGFANVAVHDFPITAWTRGEERAEIVAPHPQPLVATMLGGSPGTPAAGLEGEIVSFASLDALKAAAPGSLAGKIAMVQQPMAKGGSGYGYGYVGQARAFGPIEAAKRGAAAFLMRSVATGDHRFAHTGSTRYIDGRVPIPAFALSVPDADQIARLEALGERVRLRLSSSAALRPGTPTSYVVAEVKGRERPGEIVLLAAHLDSWELGTGVIDDGAGVGIVAAAAKLVADQPRRPRRTVRIALFGSEEVTQPDKVDASGWSYLGPRIDELGSHIVGLESDLGADRIFALAVPRGVADSAFARTAYRVLAPLGILPTVDLPGRGGGDLSILVDKGLPALLLKQTETRYFDYHHTLDDTLDKVDRAALDQNVAAWAALVWLAADSDVDFRALSANATKEQTR